MTGCHPFSEETNASMTDHLMDTLVLEEWDKTKS